MVGKPTSVPFIPSGNSTAIPEWINKFSVGLIV